MDKVTSHANIASMLQTLQSHKAQAGAALASPDAPLAAQAPGFLDRVKQAVDDVNASQMHARSLQNAFEQGDDVPMTEVVLAMQKASLNFEATLQVRNKVLKAYEDILNMPV
ncbi:MAG: flagellar hook-basal body complex protein FliE [Proteobacteria bacterium]|jgi:flagellar hook-basal body complex protein FliE|nr:flagellar hook-basal body complex protein FliE [Pseudomonadota bacterium]MDA0869962.1 flagellar hook-basal body complex protein FliE [Pseudomonadota bacterium]MDA1329394.1 flagellar hook-basal body complex protein FliE [Pseudomonadota bacterium]